MWQIVVYVTQLLFRNVLMDSWFATMSVMKTIEKTGKISRCPLKTNHLDSENPNDNYYWVDALTWRDK